MANEIKITITIKHKNKDVLKSLSTEEATEDMLDHLAGSLGYELKALGYKLNVNDAEDFVDAFIIENFEGEAEHRKHVYL